MATITRTLADTAGFVPQDWANEALLVLRSAIVLAPVVASDKDFKQAGFKGKSLTIPYPGKFVAQDKTPGSVASVQTPSGGNSVTLTLTQHKTVDYILEDVAFSEATAGMSMAASYGSAAGIALAEAFESDLMTQIALLSPSLALGVNSLGTVGTNLSATTLQAAQKALDDQRAPSADRFLFFSTKDRNALLADTNLQTWYAYAQSQAISNGVVPGIYGFRGVGFSQLLPGVAATPSGTSSVQTVTISGGATGGTFTLTYGAQTTSPIPFGATTTTAASIAAALQALSSVPAGGRVFVVGSGLGPFQIILYNWGTPTAITGSAAGLTGGTPALNVTNNTNAAQVNVAFHKNAIIYATRQLVTPSSAGVEIAYAMDPLTNISLRIQMQYKPEYRGIYVAYDLLYGMQALRPDQGILIAS
jgi:hypothetical protein